MNDEIKYIFFDLDGTLTDSGVGITKAVAYSLEKFGIKTGELSELYSFVGPPLEESYGRQYGFSSEKTKEAIGYFHEYYDETGVYENRPYEGIDCLLEKLRKDGKKIVIASSKPENMVLKVLERFDLRKYFDFIAAATPDFYSGDRVRKNKEDVIQYALDELGIEDVSSIIMVGDRCYDIQGAHNFGIHAIGVLYGFGDRKEMEEAHADFIAPNVNDIYEVLQNICFEGRTKNHKMQQ